MARMSIDDMILRDPRVMRLAKLCGFDRHGTVGRLLCVFAIVYDRVDDHVSEVDIDVAADCDGFAKHMIDVGLAVRERRSVRIRGASKRIEYLQTLAQNASAAGRKSGESRRNKSNTNRTVPFMETNGPTNLIPTVPVPVPVVLPVPDPDPVQEKNSAAPSAGGFALDLFKAKVDATAGEINARRKPKPSEPTAIERAASMRVLEKLTERNGVRYSGSPEHLRLITNHLRASVPEMDLRFVVAYCAAELGWADDPEMAKYLRPETLFGPKTIAKYLDPARAWVAKMPLEQPEHAGAA